MVLSRKFKSIGWHLYEIKNFFKFLRKYIQIIIIFYLILIILILFVYLGSLSVRIDSSDITFASIENNITYFKCLSSLAILLTSGNIIFITSLLFWAFFSFLMWPIVGIFNTLIFSLFYKEKFGFISKAIRFNPYLSKIIILDISIIFIFLVKIRIWEFSISRSIRLVIILVLIQIPIFWGAIWCGYLRIRKKRKNTNFIDTFLFSRPSVLSSFKSIVRFMLWLALLSRMMIPLLVNFSESIGIKIEKSMKENHEYVNVWNSLAHAKYINGDSTKFEEILPNPEKLAWSSSPLPIIEKIKNEKQGFPSLLNYVFLIVILAGFHDIGFRVIGGSILNLGARKTFKGVLFTSGKTIVLTIIIQLFIKNAYFIDMNEPIGIGVLFMLLFTFFLTVESRRFEEKGG